MAMNANDKYWQRQQTHSKRTAVTVDCRSTNVVMQRQVFIATKKHFGIGCWESTRHHTYVQWEMELYVADSQVSVIRWDRHEELLSYHWEIYTHCVQTSSSLSSYYLDRSLVSYGGWQCLINYLRIIINYCPLFIFTYTQTHRETNYKLPLREWKYTITQKHLCNTMLLPVSVQIQSQYKFHVSKTKST